MSGMRHLTLVSVLPADSLHLFFQQKFSCDVSLGATEVHAKLFHIQDMKSGPFGLVLAYSSSLIHVQKWSDGYRHS